MASEDVMFVAEDLDLPPDEAVGDASAAVWRPHDAVLYLCFVYSDVVVNCLCVWFGGGEGCFSSSSFWLGWYGFGS